MDSHITVNIPRLAELSTTRLRLGLLCLTKFWKESACVILLILRCTPGTSWEWALVSKMYDLIYCERTRPISKITYKNCFNGWSHRINGFKLLWKFYVSLAYKCCIWQNKILSMEQITNNNFYWSKTTPPAWFRVSNHSNRELNRISEHRGLFFVTNNLINDSTKKNSNESLFWKVLSKANGDNVSTI